MGSTASGKHEARTTDISEGGCFIDTLGQAAVGEMVNFKLRLPAGDWIEVEGEVLYESPRAGFGVRFTNISQADQRLLQAHIKAEEQRENK
ncbi:MAG TPA: hypothetical protein DCK93_11775 [Blastocatellia bacterium]|nr:hypothetical protein [Blastocatellia bacterium]